MIQLESKNALKQPSKTVPQSITPKQLSSFKKSSGSNGSTGAIPNASSSSTANVNQNTSFAPINITQANPGVLTLGGGGGGGIAITQTVQNTSNVSNQSSTTYAPVTNTTNQLTETISNITNYLTGSGTISPVTLNPSPTVSSIPSTTVSPSQTATQTATPTQTATSGTDGKTDYMTLLIVGGIILVIAYFFLNKRKR